jgi:hypothetical protein
MTFSEDGSMESNHDEIANLSGHLAPPGVVLVSAFQCFHEYCCDLPTVSFKGTTDALTALRPGEASCNGTRGCLSPGTQSWHPGNSVRPEDPNQ